jgi:hypothetical protein
LVKTDLSAYFLGKPLARFNRRAFFKVNDMNIYHSVMARYFHVESGKNAGIAVVFGDWPARIIKHRGWKKQIYARVMTQAEIDHVESCYRYVAIHYKSVAGLLEDEKEVLSKDEFETLKASVLATIGAV